MRQTKKAAARPNRRRGATYGDVVRECYAGVGMTQTQVAAEAATKRPADYVVPANFRVLTQSNLSRWANNKDAPSPEVLAALEIVCGRPLGWCLHALGFVEVAGTVPEAAAMDPLLSEDAKRALLATYQALTDVG